MRFVEVFLSVVGIEVKQEGNLISLFLLEITAYSYQLRALDDAFSLI